VGTMLHYRRESPTLANTYRGIAVGSVLAKPYASLIQRRLDPWPETHGLRARGQAGFRRDHRTAEHALVLHTIVKSTRKARGNNIFTCASSKFRGDLRSCPASLCGASWSASGHGASC